MDLKISTEELKKLLQQTRFSIAVREQKLQKASKALSKVRKEMEEAENRLKDKEKKAVVLQECLISRQNIPQSVLKLRNEIDRKIREVKSKNITIAMKESLEKEIERFQQELAELCDHPFVFSYDGYAGSYEMDYDDGRFGRRFCAVCGFSEKSRSCQEDVYVILQKNEGRLIKRDWKKELEDLNIFAFPLSFLRKMFFASAGSFNLKYEDIK